MTIKQKCLLFILLLITLLYFIIIVPLGIIMLMVMESYKYMKYLITGKKEYEK